MEGMAAAGWYPDPNEAGTLRWWDGVRWTDDRLPVNAPPPPPPTTGAPAGVGAVPPAPVPRLRADGTVKGPSLRSSLIVLGAGLVVLAASLLVMVPQLFDAINGPRFPIPGSQTMDLETGTWVLYQRTGTSSAAGGFSFETDRGVTLGPHEVTITGPAPVQPYGDSWGAETITRGNATYTGAVRFDIDTAGEYTITVQGEPSQTGEVLVARPVTALFSLWPWFLASMAGGLATVAGFVMWLVGAANRRTARNAGMSA